MRDNPKKSFPMEGQVLLDRKFQIMPLMEGRILFDRGRVELAPPTKTILLTILFILLFSPLFPLSAQEENDTEVNVLQGSRSQDGIVDEGEAKAFVADEIKTVGVPPTKVIKLKKKFTPPDPLKFRAFKDPEEVNYYNISFIKRNRKDSKYWYVIPNNSWRYWVGGIEKSMEPSVDLGVLPGFIRPHFVDIWVDPEAFLTRPIYENSWNDSFDGIQSVFNSTVLEEGPKQIIVFGYFADSRTAAHFPLRCEGNLAIPTGKGGDPIALRWSAKVAGGIDLDIDSDNNNGTFGGPNHDFEEDRWESDETKPGKFIPVNDGDADNDQIPGFADFDESGAKKGRENHFVQATLDVSNTMEMIKWDKAKVRFKYSCSDPSKVKPESLGSNPDKKYYTVGDGMIRIWTKDADKPRNKDTFANAGDFLPGDNQEFYADNLFKNEKGERITEIPLYIEGIGSKTTSGLIKVEFSPKGDATWMPDEVKVTVVGIDLDVDSDNDGNITDADDPIEEVSPGMLVGLNDSGAIIDKKDMRLILRKLVPSDLTGWEVYLTQTGGKGKVKIIREKGETVIEPTDNLAGELKSGDLKMLVEGVDPGEVELQAEYKYTKNPKVTVKDIAKITVFKVESVDIFDPETTDWNESDIMPWENIIFDGKDLKFRIKFIPAIDSLDNFPLEIKVAGFRPNERPNYKILSLDDNDTLSEDGKSIFVTVTSAELKAFGFQPDQSSDNIEEKCSADFLGGNFNDSDVFDRLCPGVKSIIGRHGGNWTDSPINFSGNVIPAWSAKVNKDFLKSAGSIYVSVICADKDDRGQLQNQADWLFYSGHGSHSTGKISALGGDLSPGEVKVYCISLRF